MDHIIKKEDNTKIETRARRGAKSEEYENAKLPMPRKYENTKKREWQNILCGNASMQKYEKEKRRKGKMRKYKKLQLWQNNMLCNARTQKYENAKREKYEHTIQRIRNNEGDKFAKIQNATKRNKKKYHNAKQGKMRKSN